MDSSDDNKAEHSACQNIDTSSVQQTSSTHDDVTQKDDVTSSMTSQESDSGGGSPTNSADNISTSNTATVNTEELKQPIQESQPRESVDFKVIYNKKKFEVNFELDSTIADFKKHVETLTGVPFSMQKLMFKGLAKDHETLRTLKVTKGSKFMVVGSTINDVLAVSSVIPKEVQKEEDAATTSKESFCNQKVHKKVLDKYGKPEDALPGIQNKKVPLPQVPLTGMYNKAGGKVRLTFKLEVDQLWIGTKERTEKIQMNSIKAVVSEPLEGKEEYHMMGIQLGPTEASRYWIYWVPAQYVDSIKDSILGKWQLF